MPHSFEIGIAPSQSSLLPMRTMREWKVGKVCKISYRTVHTDPIDTHR